MSHLTDEELEELEKLERSLQNPPPWRADKARGYSHIRPGDGISIVINLFHSDAEFLAAARNSIPRLIEEVRWNRDLIKKNTHAIQDYSAMIKDRDEAIEVMREALEYIVLRNDFTFAECSEAELIIDKSKEALEKVKKVLNES